MIIYRVRFLAIDKQKEKALYLIHDFITKEADNKYISLLSDLYPNLIVKRIISVSLRYELRKMNARYYYKNSQTIKILTEVTKNGRT